MDPIQVNHEWGSGPDFAEVAEALEVRTDQIMAAGQFRDELHVLYTPFENTRIFGVTLNRDAEGILRPGKAQEQQGLWKEIVTRLNEHQAEVDR